MSIQTLSTFFIGFCTAFFFIFAVLLLKFRKPRTRFHRVTGIIMAIWALWNLKDLVTAFPGMYRSDVLSWITLIDGWSALTYMVFVFEATQPGWTTRRRMLLPVLPFALFTLAYIFYPRLEVIHAYMVFLWCFGWSVIFIAYFRVRRYLRFEHDNYSNIDKIDVSWIKLVLYFAIVSQLAWLGTSLLGLIWVDIVYYLSTILLWIAVLYYTWEFHPINVDMAEKIVLPQGKEFAFAGQLEQIVEEQQLYLRRDLTVNDLAHAVDSNRTYVSSYLSRVVGETFYEYINRLRIERKAIPMMEEHPEFTLEYVASESGFSSISTFRRSFVRLKGMTPSQYSEQLV